MITTEEFNHMLNNPGAPMLNEAGDCRLIFASGDNAFVMSGPTGVHSLYAGATDLKRLNAHWSVFAAWTDFAR
jgi:hypothetical protein